MKTRWKDAVRVVLAAGAVILGLGVMEKAEAFTVADSMTVFVTPSGLNYSVSIASPEVQGYDFSSVALAATTISTLAIVVTNNGTVGEYFALAVSNTVQDAWTAIASGVPGYDQFMLQGHFVAHNAGQPLDATFSATVDTMTAVLGAGKPNFGQAGTLTPPTGSNSKDLWLRLTMPNKVASGSQQSMTLTINGQNN